MQEKPKNVSQIEIRDIYQTNSSAQSHRKQVLTSNRHSLKQKHVHTNKLQSQSRFRESRSTKATEVGPYTVQQSCVNTLRNEKQPSPQKRSNKDKSRLSTSLNTRNQYIDVTNSKSIQVMAKGSLNAQKAYLKTRFSVGQKKSAGQKKKSYWTSIHTEQKPSITNSIVSLQRFL